MARVISQQICEQREQSSRQRLNGGLYLGLRPTPTIDRAAQWAHHPNALCAKIEGPGRPILDPNTVENSLDNPTTAKPSLRHRATEEFGEHLGDLRVAHGFGTANRS